MAEAIPCQSCGMPMDTPELFGTEKGGARVEVLSPPHVRERIAAMADQIRGIYQR